MLMTPLSWNSSHRSLPSRVRSPTPANTDTPPCFSAMLWISSWMMTVLPTPAPPNRPILPPLRYGSSRSMTLMPVSNISSCGRLALERSGPGGGSASAPRSAPADPGSPPARRARSGRARASSGPRAPRSARRCRWPPCRAACRRSASSRWCARGPRPGAARLRRRRRWPSAAAGVRHDAHGVVDVGQVAVGELDVHGRADDLDDAAGVCCLPALCSLMFPDLTTPARPRPLR